MREALRVAVLAAASLAALAASAQPGSEAPAFDVAYRAWDLVTDLAKQRRDPAIAGECGKTFRPFVIPGLKPQGRPEQDVSARACVAAARTACANPALTRDGEVARKCAEFK